MSKTRRYLTVGAAILAISAGGAGAALATGNGDDGGKNGPNDSNATVKGPAADQATRLPSALPEAGRPTRSNAIPRTARPGRSR